MKTNETEKKKFVFVTCPVCGCETIADTREIENRCDICHNYFEWGFVYPGRRGKQTFSKD